MYQIKGIRDSYNKLNITMYLLHTIGGLADSFGRPAFPFFLPPLSLPIPLSPRSLLLSASLAALAWLLLPSENSTRLGLHLTPFSTVEGEAVVLFLLASLSTSELLSSLSFVLQKCLKMSAGLLRSAPSQLLSSTTSVSS